MFKDDEYPNHPEISNLNAFLALMVIITILYLFFTGKIEYLESWLVRGIEVLTYLDTLEGGRLYIPQNGWIAIGAKGERWAIQDDIFRATYEPAIEAV